MARLKMIKILVPVVLIFVLAAFQNCGGGNILSGEGVFKSKASGNGAGYEMDGENPAGPIPIESSIDYISYGSCEGSNESSLIRKDSRGFTLIRWECMTLNPAPSIPNSQVQIIGDTLIYQGREFLKK